MTGRVSKRAVLAGTVVILAVPAFLVIMIAGALGHAFKGSENSKKDLIDICVNHEAVVSPFLPENGFDWVSQCRDDIFNVRNTKVFHPDSGNAQGDEIVAYAKEYLGGPYVWGGNDPVTGADCSGFTKYVFARYGITLNRVAKDQALNGTKIDKSEVQAGDLMIWEGHVAICEGNGMVIGASDPEQGICELAMNENNGTGAFMGYYRVDGVHGSDEEGDAVSVSGGSLIAEEKAVAVLLAYGLMNEERYFTSFWPDFEKYAGAFTDEDFTSANYDVESDGSWMNLVSAGFPEIDEEMRENVVMTAEQIHGRLSSLSGAAEIAELEKYGSELLTGVEAESLWKSIFAAGNGGKFTVYTTVPGPYCGQCTDFAHWSFYQTYGTDWKGAGNGNQCVDKICSWFSKESGRRTKDGYYFVKSRMPEAGAVFSTGFNEEHGHTGFITKVENGYFWASEGNYGHPAGAGYSNIRLNQKYSIDRAQNWTDRSSGQSRGGVWYAVPRKDLPGLESDTLVLK